MNSYFSLFPLISLLLVIFFSKLFVGYQISVSRVGVLDLERGEHKRPDFCCVDFPVLLVVIEREVVWVVGIELEELDLVDELAEEEYDSDIGRDNIHGGRVVAGQVFDQVGLDGEEGLEGAPLEGEEMVPSGGGTLRENADRR